MLLRSGPRSSGITSTSTTAFVARLSLSERLALLRTVMRDLSGLLVDQLPQGCSRPFAAFRQSIFRTQTASFCCTAHRNSRRRQRWMRCRSTVAPEGNCQDHPELPPIESSPFTGRLMLIDTHALMFKFHHSYGNVLKSEAGEETGISFGVMKTLLNLLEVNPPPTHLAVVMDAPGKTFRHELFVQYKANRPPFPEEIRTAIPQLEELLHSLRIKVVKEPGVEADDVIGTLATRALKERFQVVIVSPDKDFMQLLQDNLLLLRTPKKDADRSQLVANLRIYTGPDFEHEYGLKPKQWPDVLALMGDSADNIPGVKDIGIKSALSLVQEYGTLDNILSNVPHIKKSRQKKALQADSAEAVAKFSQALVTIDTDLQIPTLPRYLDEYKLLPLTDAEKQDALNSMQRVGFREHTQRWQRVWQELDNTYSN